MPKHEVRVNKKSDHLNKVDCLCGLSQFFTSGLDADHCAEAHSRKNKDAKITTYVNGVEEIKAEKRAHPGRYAGSITQVTGTLQDNR